jgi:hypothetical protein
MLALWFWSCVRNKNPSHSWTLFVEILHAILLNENKKLPYYAYVPLIVLGAKDLEMWVL